MSGGTLEFALAGGFVSDIVVGKLVRRCCLTCAHYGRRSRLCSVRGLWVADGYVALLPRFADGPCDRWKCRYARKAR